MSLAVPPHPQQLRAARRDAVLFTARAPSRCAVTAPRASPGPGPCPVGAYCLFSGSGRQNEARRALESSLGQSKYGFEKWGVGIERGRRRDRRIGPGPAAGRGGSGGGGWSGGGGGWFRWFSSGGFWDAAKQTVLTILGIIAAVKGEQLASVIIVLVAAIVNPLLAVLRQIRRALNFAVHCVSRGMSAPSSGPKSTSASANGGNLATVPVKGGVGMTAKERVIRKWGLD